MAKRLIFSDMKRPSGNSTRLFHVNFIYQTDEYNYLSIIALILRTPAEEDCSFIILNFPRHSVFST